MGWNDLGWSAWIRWPIGVGMLLLGHALMMPSVAQFGYDQTSGGDTGLRTTGLYRFSRNPQYLGDILILLGWCVLSAAPLAMIVAAIGIASFIVAPLCEEPWMAKTYGEEYRAYRQRVRRFI